MTSAAVPPVRAGARAAPPGVGLHPSAEGSTVDHRAGRDASVAAMAALALAASVSPNGNLEAVLEQDDRCAHLYLREVEGSLPLGLGVRSCWVRNLWPAPPRIRIQDMREGLPALMPAPTCAHPGGAPPLSKDAVRFVWLEEGDAVALLEGEEVLAIMPCWSGRDGFQGYARDCTEESPFASPLGPDNVFRDRIRAAAECWRSWLDGNPWAPVREAGEKAVAAAFGKPTHSYAIDDAAWPPQTLFRCARGDAVVLVTCGRPLRPQPSGELHAADPRPLRRIELALGIERGLFELGPERIVAWLSAQAHWPWRRLTWLGHHHTVPCDAIPPGPSGRAFGGALLLRHAIGAPELAFPPFRGDPVTPLWLVPITGDERGLAERGGSEELARRLARKGHGFVHRDRAPVV